MRSAIGLVLLALVFVASPASARVPWRSAYDSLSEYSPEPYRIGRTYRVDVAELLPTQFAVGMREVRMRAEKIENLDKHDLREYLIERVGSLVIGPGETFYLVDGHHLARALTITGHEEMLVRVLADWSSMDQDAFFERMIRHHYLWPFDENGQGPRDPHELPGSLRGLRDDPYRSLAYLVRKAGGFRETSVPFAEFHWANYFRERISLERARRVSDETLREAYRLAREPEARRLPGFIPRRPRCEGLLLEEIR